MKKLLPFFLILILSFTVVPFVRGQEVVSLHLSPSSGIFFIGNTFDVSIIVNTNGNRINAIRADLRFPADKLQVVSPVAGKSFVSVWTVPPTYSNTDGKISLQGGVPSPGISTSAGVFSTITFRAKTPGTVKIEFLDSSLILLDDGKGTNVLRSFDKGEYSLVMTPPEGPRVYSSTHSDQEIWYKDSAPIFSWEKTLEINDFSYTFDQDSKGVPDAVSEGSGNIKSYANVSDGIWYFHIRSERGGTWGATSHYVVHIDSTPPNTFTPKIESTGKEKRTRPLISFLTNDAVSSVDHYEIKIAGVTQPHSTYFIEATNPYRIPLLEPGEYSVIVRAYDKADNFTDGMVGIRIVGTKLFSFEKQGVLYRGIFYRWWLVVLVLIVLLVLLGFLVLRFVKHGIGFGIGHDIAKIKERVKKRRKKLVEEIAEEKKLEEELEKIEDLEKTEKKTETEDKNI